MISANWRTAEADSAQIPTTLRWRHATPPDQLKWREAGCGRIQSDEVFGPKLQLSSVLMVNRHRFSSVTSLFSDLDWLSTKTKQKKTDHNIFNFIILCGKTSRRRLESEQVLHVMNFEEECVCVCVCGGGGGQGTSTSYSFEMHYWLISVVTLQEWKCHHDARILVFF